MVKFSVIYLLFVLAPKNVRCSNGTGMYWTSLDLIKDTIFIPFNDGFSKWKFQKDCSLICTQFFLKCYPPASRYNICHQLKYMHTCCERYVTMVAPTKTSLKTAIPSPLSPKIPSSMSMRTTTMRTTLKKNPICPVYQRSFCSPAAGCQNIITDRNLIRPECALECWKFCFDQCGCKTHARGQCEYHVVTGMCLARRESCDQDLFEENECVRGNSFYTIGGVLCFNRLENRAGCDDENTIFAVNINGESILDSRGVQYESDALITHEDPHITKINANKINFIQNHADKHLYGYYSKGRAQGNEEMQCLYYTVLIELEGDYELAVRTLEPDFVDVGNRLFSITLNNVVIVPQLDLFALSGKLLHPVDIVTNFQIRATSSAAGSSRRIFIKGHNTTIDMTNYIRVGFCISDCRLCSSEYNNNIDPGYVVAGFSIVRFPSKRSH